MVGYRYIHTAIDDRTRIAYSEIHNDEQAVTAAGFWARAAAWYQPIGIDCRTGDHRQRLLLPLRAVAPGVCCDRHHVKKTRPYRPQTNGKVERFHRILLEEWAYIRPWTSETNAPRPTTGSSTSTITTDPTERSDGQHPPASSRDNLPEEHT